MNETNLAKLRDKLATVDRDLFCMKYFRAKGDQYHNEPSCGTTACALGWAPTIPGMGWEFATGDKAAAWNNYSRSVMGIDPHGEEGHNIWDFLFAFEWSRYDNSPLGAAKRIQYVLNGGEIPASVLDLLDAREEFHEADDTLADLIADYEKMEVS